MAMIEIRQQIRNFVLENFLDSADPTQLRDDVSLERSHIVDSARMMDLILFIEQVFGFTVEDEEAIADNFETINNLVAYVSTKVGRT